MAIRHGDQREPFDAVARGAALFRRQFTPAEGLGPLFNERACSSCHVEPAIGGMGRDGLATVLRAGRLTSSGFDATLGHGRGARRIEAHAHSVAELGVDCDRVAGIPPAANTTSVRNAPPLFGSGLIDAIPDEVIAAGAVPKGRGVEGRPNYVRGPDGRRVVGRFGWKGDTPTLEQFVADAFRTELGVTSPLAPAGPLPADARPCPGDSSAAEIGASDVRAVVAFLDSLPAPRVEPLEAPGARVFTATGCAACHVPELDTGSTKVPLYSDLLLHDMGRALDDGFVQGEADGADWRTTPLWGLSQRKRFLHDGRADDLRAAIVAHGGEAEAATRRFLALSRDDLRALLDFLRTL
ncbi:MAG: c-type cytochrome [Actinomycetota bacterium]|nr:c-type cytochrome [Actinomycetota bacterium]